MEFDWDDGKAAKNLRKHQVAFEAVYEFEFDTAVIDRFEYQDGEERIVQFGFIGSKLHVLVYTERGDVIWVISLRHAERHEWRKFYGTA
jgi:uncharacterized protein